MTAFRAEMVMMFLWVEREMIIWKEVLAQTHTCLTKEMDRILYMQITRIH